jgi:hypothetical protein
VFTRSGDEWLGRVIAGDGLLHMPEIGVAIPLGEFYEGVEFPAADDAAVT